MNNLREIVYMCCNLLIRKLIKHVIATSVCGINLESKLWWLSSVYFKKRLIIIKRLKFNKSPSNFKKRLIIIKRLKFNKCPSNFKKRLIIIKRLKLNTLLMFKKRLNLNKHAMFNKRLIFIKRLMFKTRLK